MAALIVCLMASSSTVGFGFLPSVVALLRQVMSTNTDLDGLHSASEESVPVKFPLRNLTICGSLFGLPVLLILQSLPSELFGPAFQGGVSCVHIIGAAITHTRYTHGGSIKKKPTLLPRPRVILGSFEIWLNQNSRVAFWSRLLLRGLQYTGFGGPWHWVQIISMPLLGSLVVVYFRVDSRILHETSVLLSLLLPRYFAATITFISTTGPSRDVVCVILSILLRGRVILPYPLQGTGRTQFSHS